MQYPPGQEPSRYQQPAPAEIYVPEQPQAYSSAAQVLEPQRQPSGAVQEIIVYSKRGQTIFRATVCAIGVVFLIGLIISAFLTNGPLQPGDIAPMIVTLLIVAAACSFMIRLGWITLKPLIFHEPMLTINREGITVNRVPSMSGFSLAWSEIEVVSISTVFYKYLCISPKNPTQFLKRFSPLERLIRRSNALVGIPPLVVPQVFLEKPLEEIMQQVAALYWNELNYYRVQLQ